MMNVPPDFAIPFLMEIREAVFIVGGDDRRQIFRAPIDENLFQFLKENALEAAAATAERDLNEFDVSDAARNREIFRRNIRAKAFELFRAVRRGPAARERSVGRFDSKRETFGVGKERAVLVVRFVDKVPARILCRYVGENRLAHVETLLRAFGIANDKTAIVRKSHWFGGE